MFESTKTEIANRFKIAFARNPAEAAVKIWIAKLIANCPDN
jgi:hypothetical protein